MLLLGEPLAIKDYDKAIEINPKLAEANHNRGVAHYEKGEYEFYIIDWANAGFLFLIRARKAPTLLKNATEHLAQAFSFDKSKHVIKFEAGIAHAAILKRDYFTFLTKSLELKEKDSQLAKMLMEESADTNKDVEEILSNVKEKEPALCASAKAVLTALEGDDAEIKEIKDFKLTFKRSNQYSDHFY